MSLPTTRTDLMPDQALIKRISNLEDFINGMNSTYQQIGSHSLVTSRLYSANPYDIEVDNIPTSALTTPVVVQVTFTPSSTLLNNLSLVHTFIYTFTQDTTHGFSALLKFERLLPSNNQQTWNIYIFNESGTYSIAWVRIKFYFFIVGSGTFSATVL